MKSEEASSTALTVAQGILYCAGQPATATLVSSEVSDALNKILSSSKEGQKRLAQLKNPLFKIMMPIMESLIMPAVSLHYVLRKRYIEDYALKCINEGATQVVNLGAGFDTLCYRLSKRFDQLNFFEIDHPATNRLKAEALKNEPCFDKNLTLLPVDFTQQTLEDRLGSHPKFISAAPTLFISEGVLAYLTEEQVRHQLRVLKEMTDKAPKLIFTFSEPNALQKDNNSILLSLYLKIKGEPFKWTIMRNDLSDFLKSNGYALKTTTTPAEFKSNYVSDDYKGIIHNAEKLAIAEGVV